MAQVHKLLGRASPAALATDDVYTAPALTVGMCTCITITNTDDGGMAADVVRVHIVPPAGSSDKTNAIIYDLTVKYGNPFCANLAHDIDPGSKLTFYSKFGRTTLTASGLEIS